MNIRNFDLNLLITFDVLMRERSVSRAASKLALTQPAVSNALNRLRQQLGDPLLVRTQRGMAPTKRALELLAPVQSALKQIDQCLITPAEFDPLTSDYQFVLGTTDYVALLLMPDFLKKLNLCAPNVEIEIKNLGPIDTEQALEKGIYDFAVGRFLKTNHRLHSELWLQDRLCCLVRKGHPVTANHFQLDEFLTLEHIWVTTTQRRSLVDTWLESHQHQRKISLTLPSYTTAAMIVADSNMGLVLPQRFAEKFSAILPVTALPLPTTMDIDNFDVSLMWHPVHASTPAHSWFRQQLLAIANDISGIIDEDNQPV